MSSRWLPAGEFGDWLDATRRVQVEGADADVPCGGCTACCTSSQFVLVGPDEHDTIAAVPEGLLFPAPGMPEGNLVLGYDAHGHCPMLREGRCTIYDHRPRTCRAYDCRVFAAAGDLPGDPALVEIRERAEQWRFDHADDEAERRHAAVEAAAGFLEDHGDRLPPGAVPGRATQRALLAVAIHHLFVDDTPSVPSVAAAIDAAGLTP